MNIVTPRFAPWQDKSRLSPSQYEALTGAVSKVLHHTISIPDSDLDVSWSHRLLRTYVQDDARHTLRALDIKATEAKLAFHELMIRKAMLQLALRLAKIRGGLDVVVLIDLATTYGANNATSLRVIFQEAYKATPSLRERFKVDVVPAFVSSLQDVQSRSASSTRKVAYVLSQLLRCGSAIVTSFMQDEEFIPALAQCYHIGLDNFAKNHGGVTLQDSQAAAGWQRDWLYTKTSLVDSFHAIVQTLLQGKQPHDGDKLFDILFSILELPSSSISERTTPVPFVSQSLLADYQYAFDLSGVLSTRLHGVDVARVDLLASMLAELSPSPHGAKPAGGLSLLIPNDAQVRKAEPAIHSATKGKGKASHQDLEMESIMDHAVAQVMEIFPSHSLEHIRRCLEHSAFCGDPEKLISSLLEGTMPPELADDKDTPPGNDPPVEEFKFVKDRRNVWDDDVMDFSKLRIGKARNNTDALLHDRTFIEQMKADIIRRAGELSGDEENLVDNLSVQGRAVPFFDEELDDGALTSTGVKVAGDGEASDDTNSEDEMDDTPTPETILELAYLSNPKLFDRDSATRRSKARSELRSKTGWVDEQIEGWRIMLERNPRKDKILQKHEFRGNAPLVANTNSMEPGPSSIPQQGGRPRGRGANGNTAQGRASKEKNKARSANHNRKRGHDKKMARGGAPIA